MFNPFCQLTLQVEVTTACNLDCKICMRRGLNRPEKFLSIGDFKKILGSGRFRYVGLHGWGEPLLAPDLFDMVSYAESRGISTNLTNNGTIIQRHLNEVFASGLREIAFGVYDRDLFQRVLPHIEEFVAEKRKRDSKRPKSYLDITIYQGNAGQVPELLKSAAEIGIDAVILHRLFNVYAVNPEEQGLSEIDEDRLFKEARQVARDIGIELYLPPRHSFPCRIVKYSIFVNVDGKVTPCTYLPETCVGDALKEGVAETMRSRAYREFVKNMKLHPICSRCRW